MRIAQPYAASCLLLVAATTGAAQEIGSINPQPLAPLDNPDDPKTPAKELFGRKTTPTTGKPRAIGFYAAGCLTGGTPLPASGATWQVMRLSRNRNWGHPQLLGFLENLGTKVQKTQAWHGLLIGDMSQPRGGPMISGHISHQIGLEVDIWLRPMPNREVTRAEREEMLSTDVVADDGLDVDPSRWTPGHRVLIQTAASDQQVDRIFVNPAIKKALCREVDGERTWLRKVRPYWGHDYHVHVRLRCPANEAECEPQRPPPPDDGCEADLDWWFTDEVLHPEPSTKPAEPPATLTMTKLPSACAAVLAAP